MNLDFAKVCGKHSAIYEAYYKQIDPKGSGAIEAMTAAKFLKKSGLSDVVLSRVWDLSDPNGKGFLDKPGFFVALKLVSLAQAGQVANMSNIYMETANPPKVGDLPKIMPPRIQTVPVSSGGMANGDWSISVIDRLKYEQLFESLKPVGNMLPGNKVKGVLMDSKLPMETLGKIWDLADQDKDGNLDKHEFIVAMHLVYQTLEKRTVPDVLPVELRKPGAAGPPPPKPMPPAAVGAAMPRAPSGEGFGDGGFVANFPKDIAPPPAVPPPPAPMSRVPPVGGVQPLIPTDPLIPIGAPPSVTANADWVVVPSELKRYEVIFRDSDRDKDGLVSGLEVKNVFLQSGVPQQCLAHIWALCDTNQSGKLTLEQFALAMWMVERKQKGIEPPQVLTANMVPPSMRGIISGVDVQAQVEPKPTYSNPELEMISKEIEELARERRALETEIAQKEADIRIKSGEVRSLQSELDTLSATLKQLENQRGEAQKRLDDLKAQVNKIREQCQKQEDTINEQEGELNAKRSELQKLKDEETALQQEYDDNNREMQKLTQHLQNTQLQISSVRSMVTQLLETQRQMTDALLMCRAAIENQDGELVSEYQLKIEPDFDEARRILEKKIDEPKPDPFADTTTSIVKPTSNGFNTNGFASDPFTSGGVTTNTVRGGFDDSFNTSSGFDSGFDAFGSGFGQPKDPFGSDAFGASKVNAVTPEPGKDDFGSDPFAALHAPTGQGQVLSPNTQKSGPPPRPESPSPALPPKKSKVPPPRPAPPRPMQGPARPPSATDAFGSASNSSGGFADFADFDNKLTSIPTTLAPSLVASSTFAPKLTAPTASFEEISLFDAIASSSTTTTTISTTATTSYSFSQPAIASTTIATTANNHSTHFITPLQQAPGIFDSSAKAWAPATAISGSGNKGTTALSGPTDFSDDPFKNYRYEDPFNIKDPFTDDETPDPEQVFKDDLSSDDEKIPSYSYRPGPEVVTVNVDGMTNLANQFGEFTVNPSPVPSQKSTTSGGYMSGSGGAGNTTTTSETRSLRNTPISAMAITDNSVGSGNQSDNFANFDAFSTKSSSTVGSLGRPGKEKNASSNNNDANDIFFDAFNDNFNTNSNAELIKPSTNVFDAFGDGKNANMNTFDAFISNATTTTKTPNMFDDTFEDDFFKSTTTTAKNESKNFNINVNTSNSINNNKAFPKSSTAAAAATTTTTVTATTIDNFAKFNAFDDSNEFDTDFANALNNSINNTTSKAPAKSTSSKFEKLKKIHNPTNYTKTSNISVANTSDTGAAKPPTKFAPDYSNAETFDADLQEALKRSMLEK